MLCKDVYVCMNNLWWRIILLVNLSSFISFRTGIKDGCLNLEVLRGVVHFFDSVVIQVDLQLYCII